MYSHDQNKKKPEIDSESEWDSPSEVSEPKTSKKEVPSSNPARSVSAITQREIITEISDNDQKNVTVELPKKFRSKSQESKIKSNTNNDSPPYNFREAIAGSGDGENKFQASHKSNKQRYESTILQPEECKATDNKSNKLQLKFYPDKILDEDKTDKSFTSKQMKKDINYPELTIDYTDFEYENQIYYFEKGSNKCLKVENRAVTARTLSIADESSKVIQRLWLEVFGVFRIATNIFTIFFIEFFRFTLHYLFQPVLIGSLTLISDYLIKPLLTTLFNGFLQPVFILSWNMTTSIREVILPCVDILQRIIESFAIFVRAFRLVEINRQDHHIPQTV